MLDLLNKVSSWYLKQAYIKVLDEVISSIETVKRLDRAYEILTRDNRYEIHIVDSSTFRFVSPNDEYTVTLQSCSCPDSEKLCKHRLALRIVKTALIMQRSKE